MKYLITGMLATLPLANIYAQDKGDFSVELNVNANKHNMTSPNQFIAGSNAYQGMTIAAKNNAFNTLDLGSDYNVSVSYQPLKFMDFGIFANYQASILKRTFSFKYYPDPFLYPDSSYIKNGKIQNQTTAFCFGISSNLYFNKLFHFESMQSAVFSKLILSLGVKTGVGFSSFTEKSGIEGNDFDYINLKYNASNFVGRTEISIGYPLSNKSLFSNIGIRLGYQFFKTSPIRNYADLYLYADNNPNTKINLDFSGLYYGVCLKFGKH